VILSPTKLKLIQPPEAWEMEQAVLGTILKEGNTADVVIDILDSPSHFYAPRHQTIYKAMLSLHQRGEPCDITTVAQELTEGKLLEQAGGRVYLVELAEHVASTVNVTQHAKVVLEKSALRQTIQIIGEINIECYAPGAKADEVLTLLQQKAFDLGRDKLRRGFVPLKDSNSDWLQLVQDYETGEAQKRVVLSGFKGLDDVLFGFEKGTTNIIAGHTSHGKTQLALQICEHVAMNQNRPVGIVSIEMNKIRLNARLQCSIARVDYEQVKRGKLTSEEHDRIALTCAKTSTLPIFIDDSACITPDQLLNRARIAVAEYGIELLVVDYLQIMNHTGKETRERVVADLSRRMKRMAGELDIPVIVLSQLKRGDSAENRSPVLSDLRESGAIEQDADTVIFVYHHKDKNGTDLSELILAKNRDGKTQKTIPMTFIKGRWNEPSYREELEL